MDETGRMLRSDNLAENSEAPTFSNLDPTTSDAQAMGGSSSIHIWGTNISMTDSLNLFKDFLKNYTKKYRMWAEGMSEEETRAEADSEVKEYVVMMQNMLTLGITSLNIDFRNLKAYPPTRKFWQQGQDYPHEMIAIMDQSLKDCMYELAEEEMAKQRASQTSAGQSSHRSRVMSSEPPVPSSELSEPQSQQSAHQEQQFDLVEEVTRRIYNVRPFGLDTTVNMRELNPSGNIVHLPCKRQTNDFQMSTRLSQSKASLSVQVQSCQIWMQHSSNVRFATIQFSSVLIEAEFQSQRSAREQCASHQILCKSSTTDQTSGISRLSSSKRPPTPFLLDKHHIPFLYAHMTLL